MPSIGAPEIVIILVIALLVFGPKRLPEMGRSLGRSVREFKKASDTARKEFGVNEIERELKDVKKTLGDVKGDLKIDVDAETAKPSAAGASAPVAGAAAAGVISADAAAAGSDAQVAAVETAPGDGIATDASVDDGATDDDVLVGEVVDDGASGDAAEPERAVALADDETVGVECTVDDRVEPSAVEDETAADARPGRV